jgi:hypothetical protein
VAKRKTTIYIEDELLRTTKVLAARTGRREYEIVGDALRSYHVPQGCGVDGERPQRIRTWLRWFG